MFVVTIVVETFVVDWVVTMVVKVEVKPKVVGVGCVVKLELVIMVVVGTPVVASVFQVVTEIVAIA